MNQEEIIEYYKNKLHGVEYIILDDVQRKCIYGNYMKLVYACSRDVQNGSDVDYIYFTVLKTILL